MIFQFEHMQIDSDPTAPSPKWTHVPWHLDDLKRITTRWQHTMHNQGWNSLFLSNHDVPRMVSRFGHDGIHRLASAKLLATFLMTLQGTPFIYQGDEIGMTNVQFEHIEDYRDIDTLNFYQEQLDQHTPNADILALIYAKGRDNARTPMQWDASPKAGFSTASPWIGVNPNHLEINVAQAWQDPNSVFWYYRDLIRLRRKHSVIVHGSYELLLADHPTIYAYTRSTTLEKLLVLLNFSPESVTLTHSEELPASPMRLLLGNVIHDSSLLTTPIQLQPYEARVYLATLEDGESMA